ncbi:MAG: tetratricopeptide repeat protein [Muribaculaceae bacterium]|nr:tetratricopeptide repeat protein [Muribaculaceae bacterium]
MAKNGKETTRTSIDEINDSLSSIEQHVENNKKIITWSILGIVVVAAVILGYVYGIHIPNKEKSINAISQADIQLAQGNDSIALAQYMNVANEYSNASGNRAALESAILLYKNGKYQEALNYLDQYDATESLVGAAANSLKGDCYVNLKNYDGALSSYDKALKISADNSLYTPVFMMKKATVMSAQKDYKGAKAIYEKIEAEYPEYAQNYRVDIDKYIERASALAGE